MSFIESWIQHVMKEMPGCTTPEIRSYLRQNDRFMSWLENEYRGRKTGFLRKNGYESEEEAINADQSKWNYYSSIDNYFRQRVSGPLSRPETSRWYRRTFPDGSTDKERAMYWLSEDVGADEIIDLVELEGYAVQMEGDPHAFGVVGFSTLNKIEVNGQTGEKAIYEMIEDSPDNFLNSVQIPQKKIKRIYKDQPVLGRTRPDVVILFEDDTAVIVEVQSMGTALDPLHMCKVAWYEYEVRSKYGCDVTKIIVLTEQFRTMHAEFLHEFSKLFDNKIEGYRYSIDKNEDQYTIKIEEQI